MDCFGFYTVRGSKFTRLALSFSDFRRDFLSSVGSDFLWCDKDKFSEFRESRIECVRDFPTGI